MTLNIKQFRPSFMKDAPVADATPRKCEKCPTMLQPWLKRYCSGFCLDAAMKDGSYENAQA